MVVAKGLQYDVRGSTIFCKIGSRTRVAFADERFC